MATQKELAEHLDISDSRIRQLILNGILPATKGRGGYDLDVCRLAYIRYLRGVSRGTARRQDTEQGEDGNDYRTMLEREKWRQAQRENDLAEKTVAPLAVITAALSATAAQMVPILEALPLEAKRRNPRLTGHDIHLMKQSVARCRNALAAMQIDEALI